MRLALAAVMVLAGAACASSASPRGPTTSAAAAPSAVEVPPSDECRKLEGVVSSGVVDLPPGHPCRLDRPISDSSGPKSEPQSFVITKHAADKSILRGRVRSLASEDPLAGVTIVVTGPAMQGTESAITEADGYFELEGLPAGNYVITFYYANVTEKRPIEVRSGYQTEVSVDLDVGSAPSEPEHLDAPEGMLLINCWR